MARIDTSELLFDDDFVDTVQLIRRTSSVNAKGRNEVTESAPVKVLMSVQGVQTKDFMRNPELVDLRGVKSVWYSGPLLASTDGAYSDIIVISGVRYQVVKIDEDYLNFGGGYVKAFCSMEKSNV